MTDKLLREAAQNILNGIETGAIRIETKQSDETWANALKQDEARHNSAPPWRKRSRGRVMGQPSSASTL
jgi:hypothetical protein